MSTPTVCSNSKRVGGLYPTSISISCMEQSFVQSPGDLPHSSPPAPPLLHPQCLVQCTAVVEVSVVWVLTLSTHERFGIGVGQQVS